MGRYDCSTRKIVEDCHSISVFALVRAAKTEINKYYHNAAKREISLILSLFLKEKGISLSQSRMPGQSLKFTTSPAIIGDGLRYWLVCPDCGQRAAKLYSPWIGTKFKCRKCHGLIYKAQKEHDKRVDSLLKNSALLNKLSVQKHLKKSQELVLIKALMKSEFTNIDTLLTSKAVPKARNDQSYSIDLGSFGKK